MKVIDYSKYIAHGHTRCVYAYAHVRNALNNYICYKMTVHVHLQIIYTPALKHYF